MNIPKTITLAFTGASGMPYGIRLLELLLAGGNRVYLLYSQAAQIVAQQELQLVLPSRSKEAEELFSRRFSAAEGQLRVFGREEWFAPVASGSNPADAMVVCPCTMGTLAAIAAGHERVGYPQMIEYTCHDKIHNILHIRRVVIKSRVGREDHSATARKFQHIIQVNRGKRRFARNQNELTVFLQHYVC